MVLAIEYGDVEVVLLETGVDGLLIDAELSHFILGKKAKGVQVVFGVYIAQIHRADGASGRHGVAVDKLARFIGGDPDGHIGGSESALDFQGAQVSIDALARSNRLG